MILSLLKVASCTTPLPHVVIPQWLMEVLPMSPASRVAASSAGSSQDGVTDKLQVTADEAYEAAVQSHVSLQAGRNTQTAMLLKYCTALNVSAELK
ncbi:TPA: hypothetical protein ACH3X2_013921 [Trebouxia sp. C0005]